ncbi:hypothetical protein [Saccharopolyspora antimicrobica]|uniref:hypothetical protein n=1 Tax=Saccharopolyspora antimicrobica TaxID=455193 RepID=UPI001160226B|nr:hypothetical protein [Saccharopolyspora antimicrobica]
MQSVGYWEAWSLWWSGQKLDNYTMWWIPLLWWARIGKLMQFAGGVAVVLDLAGPNRLRRFASKMPTVEKRSTSAMKLSRRTFDVFFETVMPNRWSGCLLAIVGGLLLNLSGLAGFKVASLLPYFEPQILFIFTAILVGFVVFFSVYLSAIHLVKFLVYPLSFIVRNIAVFLELTLRGNNPGHPLRWIAFALFVYGFHLDLLGS